MSEAKFTKGQWRILPLEDDKEYIRIRGTVLGGRYKIANVTDLKFHHDGKGWCLRDRIESAANAHLIAAAPEMYNLLKECKEVLGGTYDVNDWPANGETCCDYMMRDIEKLLAKARGES